MISCPICANKSHLSQIGTFKSTGSLQFSQQSYQYIDCPKCTGLSLSPPATQEDINKLYCDAEYNAIPLHQETDLKIDYYQKEFLRMLEILERQEKKSNKVLEIGAGYGFFSRAVKRINPDFYVICQDVTQILPPGLEEIDEYFFGQLDDPYLKHAGQYHVIVLTHVIQHLIDPVKAIRYLTTLLHTPACIYISGPEKPDYQSEDFNWNDFNFHSVPGHNVYYNEQSLRALAKKTKIKLLEYNRGSSGAFSAILGI